MTNFVIGSQAEIIDEGMLYTTYTGFALKNGYPDAAAESDCEDTRRKLVNGDVVTLLASGKHEWSSYNHPIWVVETTHNERYLISEEGLRSLGNITVLKDESLGGIEREYREVKRKAAVGERIKITAEFVLGESRLGEIRTVVGDYAGATDHIKTDGKWSDGSPFNPLPDMYVTLEPTEIVRINGARFRMIDRKAAVGERVLVTDVIDNYGFFSRGNIGIYKGDDWVDFNGQGNVGSDTDGGEWAVGDKNGRSGYRVLEPVETAERPEPLSAKPAPDQAAEIIAKLTTRVASLERRVTMLELANVKPIPRRSRKTIGIAQASAEALAETTQRTSVTVAEVTANLAQRAKEARQRRRDDIVKRAKEDVADLLAQNHPDACVTLGVWLSTKGGITVTDRVDFVVDREKRTVVALIVGIKRKKVIGRGIAKCAPGDVFNSHIGRAISLRRALGLEIPEEYVSAPQPTEVRVGDVVDECGGYDRKGRVVDAVRPRGYAAADEGLTFEGGGWAFISECKIIDDSRESDSAEPRKEVA